MADGVAALGRAEGRYAVADGLDAGQRRTAGRERPQQQDDQRGADRATVREAQRCRLGDRRVADEDLVEADGQHREDAQDEPVRGDREQRAGLVHAAEVHEHEDEDDPAAHPDRVRKECRERRREVLHTRGDRHRDRHHVVDQERGRRDERRVTAQVRLADGIGTAAVGVRVAGLPVAQRHEAQQADDHEGDPRRGQDHRGATEGEHEEDLLGRIGVRRDRVGAVDGQCETLRQQRLRHLVRAHRVADEQPLRRPESRICHDPTQRRLCADVAPLGAICTGTARTLTRS